MGKQKIADNEGRKPFCVEKSGNVQVPVYERHQTKGERVYTSYTVIEFIEGKRKMRTFADLGDAKAKAKAVAESIANGEQRIGAWSPYERLQIAEAANMASEAGCPTGDLASACRLLRDACKIVGGPDQLLFACHFYAVNKPSAKLTAKRAPDAVEDFNERRKSKISERRARGEASYLGAFAKAFKGKNLHEITPLEVADWLDRKGWAAKTRNDFLGTLGLLFADAISRGWAAANVAKSVKREKLKGGEVGIFAPADARTLLSGTSSDLRPAIALWMFSGLRKEEISRLDWSELNQGLASGSIYLPASKAKTGIARSVPISPNLRAWLEEYRRPSGPVLPEQWSGRNLDSLTRHLTCVSGIIWKDNAPRHSYATYCLAKGDKAADVVKAMGNSLRMLERHYWSRTASVTQEIAAEWFSIRPDDCAPAKDEAVAAEAEEKQTAGSVLI